MPSLQPPAPTLASSPDTHTDMGTVDIYKWGHWRIRRNLYSFEKYPYSLGPVHLITFHPHFRHLDKGFGHFGWTIGIALNDGVRALGFQRELLLVVSELNWEPIN